MLIVAHWGPHKQSVIERVVSAIREFVTRGSAIDRVYIVVHLQYYKCCYRNGIMFWLVW